MRIFRRLLFLIERLIIRGALYQLLVIALAIILISVAAGLVVHYFHSGFQASDEAIWWAFLRLTDPGYLGDDEGVLARSVSTIVTILGYVLFMGALIAIMTQGLHRFMRRLEAGVTPIAQNGHVLILGWTNRTPAIVRELLMSEGRVNRFLKRVKAARLRIVVLADDVNVQLFYDLRAELGDLWDSRKIILRSGNLLKLEHLQRVDFLNASVVIIPAAEYDDELSEAKDARVIKTAMTISNAAREKGLKQPPPLITELRDPAKTDLVFESYVGNLQIIPSALMLSRLMAQNVRHVGLSHVYRQLLTYGGGNEIYLKSSAAMTGMWFADLKLAYDEAIPLGVLRPQNEGWKPLLNPDDELRMQAGDRLVYIARKYDAVTDRKVSAKRGGEKKGGTLDLERIDRRVAKTICLFGWNYKVPVLLNEFDSYRREKFTVIIFSRVPVAQRERELRDLDLDLKNVELEHIEGDYTFAAGMADVPLARLDNIIFLASDWLKTEEESDARTVLGYLLLQKKEKAEGHSPWVLAELMDDDNEALFQNHDDEVLISPRIISHMLAHVALRPELEVIFEELFTAEGAEIYFVKPSDLGLQSGNLTFAEIQEIVAGYGSIALGIRPFSQTDGAVPLLLNPPRRKSIDLADNDEIVVLTTYA